MKTWTLDSTTLPPCHKTREDIADDLTAAGFLVKVDRFGTGNASHSGILPGCGVYRIVISEQTTTGETK